MSRKVQKGCSISPLIPEGIMTGHRSLGLCPDIRQHTGCPSLGVQINKAASGGKAPVLLCPDRL